MLLILITIIGIIICYAKEYTKKTKDQTINISYLGNMTLTETLTTPSYNKLLNKYNYDYYFKNIITNNKNYTLSFFNDQTNNQKALNDYLTYINQNKNIFLSTNNNQNINNNLDKTGIPHTINNDIKIIKLKNTKIGILSYNLIPEKNKNFNKQKTNIITNIKKYKNQTDMLFLMNNTQNLNKNDIKTWNNIFSSQNINIVFSTSKNQTITKEKNTLFIESNNNLLTKSSTNNNQIITNIKIKNNTIENLNIMPVYDITQQNKQTKIFIYDILTSNNTKENYNQKQLKDINTYLKQITKNNLGKELSTNKLQQRYFICNKEHNLDLKQIAKNSILNKPLTKAKEAVFIGDSITKGSANNNHPWYEELMKLYPKVKINNISKGGYTTIDIIESKKEEIQKSKGDIYFIAIGINDIRRRDEKSSKTSKEYITNIDKIVKLIPNKKATVVLITPWKTLPSDITSKYDLYSRNRLIEECSKRQQKYANKHGYIHIDPNPYITQFIENTNAYLYYKDPIHPNEKNGVKLYSYAVLENKKEGD